jgi:SAM-dependent methyltransferase
VRTGERAFDHVHGKPLFDWLRDHPEDDRIFSASMASISGVENAAIARAYDYGKLGTLVDVGGAHGHLLAAILKKHRGLRGILFDQPQVVAAAATDGAFLGAADVAARCDFRGGSFFDGVPEGADAYLMKYIIHDWDDELSTRILRHCREAMAPGGRVLVVDHVVKPGNGQDWAKLLDINMMVLPGGKERSKPEFEKLLAGAGLRLRRVIPTDCPLSIMEATAA